MPLNAFSGTRNWGYDGVLPFAPVSYTHLDVYKRQILHRAPLHMMR